MVSHKQFVPTVEDLVIIYNELKEGNITKQFMNETLIPYVIELEILEKKNNPDDDELAVGRSLGKDYIKFVIECLNGNSIKDDGVIKAVVNKVVSEESKVVEQYKAGKESAMKYLIGTVMKLGKGKFPADKVIELLKESIGK